MEKQNEELEEKDVVNASPSDDVQETPELPENVLMVNEAVEAIPEPESKVNSEEIVISDEVVTEKETDNPTSDELKETEVEEEAHDEEEQIDFEIYDKEQLVDFIVSLKEEDDMRKVDRKIRQMRTRFDELFDESRQSALETFMKEEGANEDDFDYRGSELDVKFNDYYGLLRDRTRGYFKNLEAEKENNLKKKEEILEKIRELVDGEESTISIKALRSLQDEWKATGPVPPSHNRTLWANYHALLDRFYDARSIYFELKELDRKKNYDLKVELCEKAESLAQQDNLKEAVIQLNELHEEYKHIGPVPMDLQEALWQRFKAASDAVYVKRKGFVEELKKDLYQNLDKKQTLLEKVIPFPEFNSDRITEWNAKTKELLGIQKEWEAIGGLPKEKAKEINKAFWSHFKSFFNAKNQFFKSLESKQEENLEIKKKLVEKAEAIRESTDWEKTANELKQLQQQWRDIGPVPEKVKNEIYNQFKKACDFFFEQRRSQTKQQEQVYEDNFKKKWDVCDQIESLGKNDAIDLDAVLDLVDTYIDLGFVPRKVIKKMHKRFDEVIGAIMEAEGLVDEDKKELKLQVQMSKLRNSPNGSQKINRKEQAIRRKIQNLENDISTYKTNIEFFAASKTADKLKAEMNGKIDDASEELGELKLQLKMLREA